MFVAAYVVLLGGLFWNMSLPPSTDETIAAGIYPGNVYDWVWGVSAGIIIAAGAALATKKNFLCLIGNGIALLGVVYSIVVIVVGKTRENYLSPWILIGAIIAVIGVVISTIFYFKEAEHIKKHGPILM